MTSTASRSVAVRVWNYWSGIRGDAADDGGGVPGAAETLIVEVHHHMCAPRLKGSPEESRFSGIIDVFIEERAREKAI